MRREFPVLEDFLKEEGPFARRYQRQVFSIHIVAFFLFPINRNVLFSPDNETKLYQSFGQYTVSADNAKTIRIEFTHFRNQLPPFEPVRDCWEHEDDPRVF